MMNQLGIAKKWRTGAGAGLRAFFGNKRGVAAIEFALIAPLMLALYLVTLELAQGIETNKKVSRVGSMVADLVGQQGRTVYREDLDAIMAIGESILKPYERSQADIVITGIEIDKNKKATVKWSRKMKNGQFSSDQVKGAPVTVPMDLQLADTFLLRVTANLSYRPVIAWTAGEGSFGFMKVVDNISMAETYNLRPRMTADMDCANC